MIQLVDRIIWNLIPQHKSIPKKAIRKIINKYGNSNQAAKNLKISRQRMSGIINKFCKPGQRLINAATGNKWEKIVKIKGIGAELSRPFKK